MAQFSADYALFYRDYMLDALRREQPITQRMIEAVPLGKEVSRIHSNHHRGQPSMYLRPMDAEVPAIYGKSYDSAQARQANA